MAGRHISQALQQVGVARLVVWQAAVARREDARLAVERINLQTRIIRPGPEAGHLGIAQRLEHRIFGETLAGLVNLRGDSKLVQESDLNRQIGQQLAILTHLALVVRRNQ